MKITCCPSCGSNFTIGTAQAKSVNSRQPLVLSCGHTICEACVAQKSKKVTNSDLHQSQVTCMTCKHTTLIENGVKDLPVNVYLSAYIEMYQRGKVEQLGLGLGHLVPVVKSHNNKGQRVPDIETKAIRCKMCVVKNATCECVDCDSMLCAKCFQKVHSLSAAIKHHLPVALSDCHPVVTTGDGEVKCTEHNRILEYFCEDDSVSICSRCYIVGRHQNHSITSIEDKNKQVLEDISSELPKARLVLQHLSQIDKKIASVQPNLKAETKSLIEDVSASFLRLHSLIQAREMEIIKNINSAYREHIISIDKQKEMMDKTRNELEDAIRKSSQLLENSATFLDGHALLETLRKARTTPCIVVKRDVMEEAQPKWQETHTENLIAIINAYGSISGTPQMTIQFSTIEEAPEHVEDDDKVSVDSLGSQSSLQSVGGAACVSGNVSSADTSEDVRTEDIAAESDVPRSSQHAPHELIRLLVIKAAAQKVTVTHICSPNDFYVQLASCKGYLETLAHSVNTWCRKSNSAKHVPLVIEKDMFVLARYTADKQWYRAQVLGVKSAEDKDNSYKVHVKYIDFGNDELVPVKELRVMQKRFTKFPVFAAHCSLTNIAPFEEDQPWSLAAIQEFHKMTQNQLLMMTIIKTQGAMYEVDLSCIPLSDALDDNYVSVRDILIFLELARFRTFSDASVTSAAPPAYPKVDFIKAMSVKNGATLGVIVLHATSPWDIQVVYLGEEYDYYLNMHTAMQEMYNDERSSNIHSLFYPRVDMVCAAKGSDGQWHRAKVLSSPVHKAVSVKLVDLGITETVGYDHLKKLHSSFIILPIQAIPCQLMDVCPADGQTGHWSDEAKLWCANNLPNAVGQAKFFRSSESTHIVLWLDDGPGHSDTHSVNEVLVDLGFAQSTGPSSVSSVQETSSGDVKLTAANGDDNRGHSKEATAVSSLTESQSRTSTYTNSSKRIVSETSSSQTVLKKTSVASSANKKTELRKDTSGGQKVQNKKPTEEKVRAQQDLQKVLNIDASTPSQKLETSYIEVFISNYISPSEFYVQVTDAQGDLLQLMKDMQEVFSNSQPAPSHSWAVNDFCAAVFTFDELWYRANIVSKVSEDEFEVEYVDFGNVDVVNKSNLRLLPPEFGKRMPCAAARCHLANLLPAGSMDVNKWSQTAIEFMATVMKDRKLYIKQEGDPTEMGLPVDLIMEEEIPETAFEPKSRKYHSMRKAIIRNGLAMPARKESDPVTPDSPGPILFQRFIYTNEHQPESHSQDQPQLGDFNQNLLPVNTTNNSQMTKSVPTKQESVVESVLDRIESHKGDTLSLPPYPLPQLNVKITVVPTFIGSDGSIYVQPQAWENRLEHLSHELQRIYGLVPGVDNMEWKVGMLCVAWFSEDGFWCRAKILEIKDDKFKVFCVDFGNFYWVRSSQLRQMLPVFGQEHPYAYHCVLHDLAPVSPSDTWPTVVLQHIRRMIMNQKCVAVVIEADQSSPLKIVLYKDEVNLCHELMSKNFAVSPLDFKHSSEKSCLIGQVLSRQNPYHQLDVGEVGDTFRALMIHIELPNVIYLQRDRAIEPEESDFVKSSEVAEINNIIGEFVEMASKLKSCRLMPMTHLPAVGVMCAAHYSVDKEVYRALSVQVFPETNSCLVVYVDYGTSEIVPRSSLRQLPTEFWSVPAQAIRCHIGHSTAGGSAQPVKHYTFVGVVSSLAHKELMARIVSKSPLTVELMIQEAGRWQTPYKHLLQRPSTLDPPEGHQEDDVDITLTEVGQEQNREKWNGESDDESLNNFGGQSQGIVEIEAGYAVVSAIEVGNEDEDDDDDDDDDDDGVDWVDVAAKLVKQMGEN